MKIKICIVTSTYNSKITNKLKLNAKRQLNKLGVNQISNINVPGAFEIPITISKLAKRYDGFIAIGCIIKGKTLNFNLISEAITNGIMQISINEKKPIGNAVLTCFNINQAKNRINRSLEAANAVVAVLKNGPKKI